MQRVLAQSEQVLAAITSILIGVDQNGCVSTWNTAARRAFGMEMHEVVGQSFERCGIAWDWATILPAIAECGTTHRPVHVENVQYKCGGRERFLGVTINPISGYSDFPVGFLLLAADITERRQTERALREREATLRRSNSVLQAQQGAAPDGILVVDENRRIVDCNCCFLNLWQIPKALPDSRDELHLRDGRVVDRYPGPVRSEKS